MVFMLLLIVMLEFNLRSYEVCKFIIIGMVIVLFFVVVGIV